MDVKSFIDLFDLCVDSFSKLFWTILGNVARDAPDVTFHPESRSEVVSVEFEGSEFGSWRTRHCSEVSLTAQASVPGTRQNTGARENEIMGKIVRNIENHLLSRLNVFQIGFIIKHQGSLCIEQRLVSKNNFLWSLIGNRETKWISENKSSSEDTLNLMKLNWWKLVKQSHFGHKHGLTMTLPRTVRSQGHRGQVNYFWGHVMCSVSTESGSRLKNQIEERVGLVNADGRPMMVLATTH